MKIHSVQTFRMLFLSGLNLLLFSLFLQWYSFQIYNADNELLVSWEYTISTGWDTPLTDSSFFNDFMKPVNIGSPLLFTILLTGGIILSTYVILFQDIEQAKNPESFYKFGYILAFIVALVFTYVCIFPVLYIISNNLIFPLLIVENYESGLFYFYSIGPGYLLQLFSFPLLFPYCIFYFATIRKFKQQEYTPEKIVENLILKSQDVLDLDKLIAEEELNQKIG
ncbi:MAG: hypothetical protein ACFFB8_03515 [Promethearchaeota archaeon]